jgi:hypothetical protein
MVRRDRLTSDVGPEASGSKPGSEPWTHMPEKSGMDAVLWLGSCANAADEKKVMAEVEAMMNNRMVDCSR